MIPAGLSIVMAALLIQAAAVGVGGRIQNKKNEKRRTNIYNRTHLTHPSIIHSLGRSRSSLPFRSSVSR